MIETAPPMDFEVDLAVERLLAHDPKIDALIVRNHPGNRLPQHARELAARGMEIPILAEWKFHPSVRRIAAADDIYYRRRTRPGELYGVPLRCLLAKNLENVATAGRCISAERAILGSVRVMPSALAVGEAAGLAGATALEHDGRLRDVPVSKLRKTLRENGAYLP